ncbi:phosphatase domain-containing putative toxin [Winogradskyella wichelsiae]|uniref:phosphatase domain-containing putative toxin n=1 Tax=Winogradskyella wichelsiae TaxID=2697007 RepID=UPI0015C9D5D3|nr:dual specificity protein phosphatase family protein [Winogradskyella wichelsiae]
MKNLTITILFFIGIMNFNYAQNDTIKQIRGADFKNLYQVNEKLYRSEQPSKIGFNMLEEMGIKTILNLRRRWSNKRKAKEFDFKLIHQPIKTKQLNEDDILNALRVIQSAEQPVLVHCWHGSDRTGTIIAAYRMVIQNWTKASAIEEFQNENLGYHESWYPNLLILLKNLEIETLQDKLNETNDDIKKAR